MRILKTLSIALGTLTIVTLAACADGGETLGEAGPVGTSTPKAGGKPPGSRDERGRTQTSLGVDSPEATHPQPDDDVAAEPASGGRGTDPAKAAALLRPEPLLVPPEGATPPHLREEWRIEPYDKDKSGASLYLLRQGSSADMRVGQVIDLGGWWLSQSVGEPYRTAFESRAWQQRSKQVQVRGYPGMQLKTDFKNAEKPVCVLFWNEPTTRGLYPRRYMLVSPEETCKAGQLEFAGALREWSPGT